LPVGGQADPAGPLLDIVAGQAHGAAERQIERPGWRRAVSGEQQQALAPDPDVEARPTGQHGVLVGRIERARRLRVGQIEQEDVDSGQIWTHRRGVERRRELVDLWTMGDVWHDPSGGVDASRWRDQQDGAGQVLLLLGPGEPVVVVLAAAWE